MWRFVEVLLINPIVIRMSPFSIRALALAGALLPAAHGAVVINEVMYHAPNDIDDLEYIELHNSGPEIVDLGGWKFTKGIKFQFPAGAKISGNGFLVLARNARRFQEYYQFAPAATFNEKLSNDGEKLALADANGKQIDSLNYKDDAPWPIGADGHSGSLERIVAEADGENPASWISSPLAEDHRRPMGTPGKPNAGAATKLGPVISNVRFAPADPSPTQTVMVQADLKGDPSDVHLYYRVAGPGFEKPESVIPMRKASETLYTATLPAQAKDQLVRFRIEAKDKGGAARVFPAATEPRPAFSYYVHETIEPAKAPFAWIINTVSTGGPRNQNQNRFRRPNPFENFNSDSGPRPPFKSALVYYDPTTRKTQLFDFVQVTGRKAGRKVRLYSDQPLNEMTTVNLIFEYDERFLFTEPMAYEVYRRAGMPAEKSYHVRTWVDGEPIGYQLLVEQPNKAFLRRYKIRDDGNMYKLLWFGQGLVGQHEKKSNKRAGHDDLQTIVKELGSTSDRAQWEVIRKNFDVEEVATYFAVNTVLTHWDGFFNNYFTYHDANGTGKWSMYPWDQDKTWGITDGRSSIFYEMPLTFGMNGDRPGGLFRMGNSPDFGGWWRPPGWFSGPLLANPYFRRIFLARTKEILENVYTEKTMFPLIDQMGDVMREEVKYRARTLGEDPARATQRLESHLNWLRDHLKKRREFLLGQKEIREAVATGPSK
jgi:hypothetical protein